MNKFATNPETESTHLADFVGLTPYGHAETDQSDCPNEDLPLAKTGNDKRTGSNSFKRDFSETDLSFKYTGPSSYGYKEIHQSNNIRAARPFWGWGSESCVQTGTWFNPESGQNEPVYTRCQSYYIFWIRVDDDCYPAYGCLGCPRHGACNQQ